MISFGLLFWFFIGLACGSFFNVCIWRIPRRQSVVYPPSACPQCKTPIKAYDNIPLISYLLLGGKCRSCQQAISVEYPLVELISGLFFAGSYYYFWPWTVIPWLFIKSLVFFSILLVISVIDLHFQIIPNRLSYSGIILGLLLGFSQNTWPPAISDWAFEYLGGALLGGGILLLIALAYPGGTGYGDVKLAAMLGAFLGIKSVLVAVFSAYILGAVISLTLIGLKIKSRKDPIPFGPFLSLGGILAFFWGELFLSWYLYRFM